MPKIVRAGLTKMPPHAALINEPSTAAALLPISMLAQHEDRRATPAPPRTSKGQYLTFPPDGARPFPNRAVFPFSHSTQIFFFFYWFSLVHPYRWRAWRPGVLLPRVPQGRGGFTIRPLTLRFARGSIKQASSGL